MGKIKYYIFSAGKETLRCGAITTLFTAPVLGVTALASNQEREETYLSQQERAAGRADLNGNGRVDYRELPEFLRGGGHLALR